MLNEAYEIHRSLQNAKIVPEAQHPSITVTLGKGTYIRVCLDEAGRIERLQTRSDDERVGLWTHSVGNGLWFPVVPLEICLFDVPEDDPNRKALLDPKASTERNAEARQAILETAMPAVWDEKSRKKAEARVQQGKELLGLVPKLDEVIQRFEKSVADGFFLDDLRARVMKNLKEGIGDTDVWLALLFGAKVRLALDVEETIYRDPTRQQVVQALLRAESGEPSEASEGDVCALSGKADALQSGPFPKVPLSVLGKEYPLFSRFYASECNARYGTIGSDSIPVSREAALQMKDAMTWLLDEDRRGKTWQAVASGRMDGNREKRDLLLVYVERLLEIDVELAGYFVSDDDEPMEEGAVVSEEEQSLSRFTSDTTKIVDALKAVVSSPLESRLQITLLRKASDGAAFVALSETPTVQNFLDGAQWWSKQGRNLPPLRIPLIPKAKGEKLQFVVPDAPSPSQAVALFTRQWRRGGTEFTPIGGVMLGEVLRLLLYSDSENLARTLLSLLLPRVSPLLIGIGGAIHRRDDAWNQFNNSTRRFALRALGFLGICLAASGHEKGTYMNNAPYQIGQILALADRLHRDYHVGVRSGPMPPSLIGNAHFTMALENPVNALSVLAARLPVYIGWAKSAQVSETTPDNVRIAVFEARKVLREYETLAAAVHGNFPTTMTNETKAEMLLGYLAGVGKDEETK